MKLVRVIISEEVRQVCVGYRLYTRGNNEAYEHLLYVLCSDNSNGTKEVSDKDIEYIACDIVNHSTREDFARFMEDTRKCACIKEMVFILANECCSTVVREN